jgi:hypothetical protein
MTYRIDGLDPAPFRSLCGQTDADLAAAGAQRMAVSSYPGFPCRIGLDDVRPCGTVLLLNHLSIPTGPYRASHAIFVEEGADLPDLYDDTILPAIDRRVLSLRAFGEQHMMVDAALAQPGAAGQCIRRLFDDEVVRYIHAHNAVRGCFAAVVERTP